MTDVPHFAFPFRWKENGRAAVVEQDSDEEIEQGVAVLLLTHLGERLEVPDFGVEELAFQDELDFTTATTAAQEWDERAKVAFQGSHDRMAALVRNLLVQVSEREG